MKILLVGNSHIGALKQAWESSSTDHGDLELDWFGAPGPNLVNMKRKGNSIVPTADRTAESFRLTSGGKDVFVPSAYDRVVIVAFGLWPRFGKIAYPISSAVHDAIYENFPKQSPFFKVHNVLQKCFSGRIFAASQPLISAESAVTTRDPSQYSAMIDEMQDRVFEKIDVQLIGQPLSTVVNHVNTDPEYSRESIGMLNQKEHGPKERQHMNVAFGELYLQRILEHLQ